MWLLADTYECKNPEFMPIGPRQRLSQIFVDPILSIESESIKRVSSTKTLGVAVDECTAWKDHFDEVAKKAAKGKEYYVHRKVFVTKILKNHLKGFRFATFTIVRW